MAVSDRFQDLVRRVREAGGNLDVLTPDEKRELENLLGERIGELEFGYPVHGEGG